MSFSRQAPVMPNSRGEVIPRFHLMPVHDEGASATAGHPIFRDKEFVEIIIPGNNLTRPVHEVNDNHRQRWPSQYAAFKAGHTMSLDGTPLEQWAMMTPAMVKTLKHLEIHTVEQCAKLDDLGIQRVGLGGRNIRNAAIAYLDDAEAMKLTTALSREAELRDAENATLRGQVAQLGELLGRLQAEMQSMRQAPSAADVFIPASQMASIVAAPAASALSGFQEPKRRARASSEEAAA
jgi:hypothetical protein